MALKPTPPEDAKTRYLKDRTPEITEKTLYNYETTLRKFTEWLLSEGHDSMESVDSEVIQAYKEYRLTQVKPITCKNDMTTIKNFIEFCETIKAVPRGLGDLVTIPSLTEDQEIADDFLSKNEADAILEYLGKYEYASKRHAIMLLLWKTGIRVSGLRALDVGDFDPDRRDPDGNPTPAVMIRHRPESGTPLKRKHKSERDVRISVEATEIIQDYIDETRPDVVDDHGREPLICSRQGRMWSTAIAKQVYTATRPCVYGQGACPFDRDPDECEATTWAKASQCPGSVSPHALRRGYATAARNAGVPKEVASEDLNMSGRVLDKHYDKGDHAEKMARRNEYFEDF
jgi:site-specific recombinase XerD